MDNNILGERIRAARGEMSLREFSQNAKLAIHISTV